METVNDEMFVLSIIINTHTCIYMYIQMSVIIYFLRFSVLSHHNPIRVLFIWKMYESLCIRIVWFHSCADWKQDKENWLFKCLDRRHIYICMYIYKYIILLLLSWLFIIFTSSRHSISEWVCMCIVCLSLIFAARKMIYYRGEIDKMKCGKGMSNGSYF